MLHNRLVKKGDIFCLESLSGWKYNFYSIALFVLFSLSLLNKGTVVVHRKESIVIEHFCHKCIIYI